jgi:hypothetical protein
MPRRITIDCRQGSQRALRCSALSSVTVIDSTVASRYDAGVNVNANRTSAARSRSRYSVPTVPAESP